MLKLPCSAALVLVSLTSGVILTSCRDDTMEEVGEDLDEVGDDIEDTAEDVGDEIEDAVDDVDDKK